MKLRVAIKILSREWYGRWNYRASTLDAALARWSKDRHWRDPQQPRRGVRL